MSVHEAEGAAVRAAAVQVGDRWTLQVVHALLAGPRRFGDLTRDVAPIAPNVLTHRLRGLEANGLVVAVPYQRRPLRVVYELTRRGRELSGALRLLAAWADPSLAPVHRTCGTTLEVGWRCPSCDLDVTVGDEGLVRL
ncbi:winged helix-turn-helix transcriptional regulator [Nitriliruptor alkaliphilus]|uniref:winged helix-turn-helix transcriptional regulator n=1 Tax=Nitriliruptor alkaliphilus TaxID=427918 RepID=UPI0006984252|nr:helix-turn-helix domain-containing protein [Nitriliruptor alkaliphilus]